MNWCQKPEKRFKLALGSFIEDYNNLVSTVVRFFGWKAFETV